MMSVRIDVNMVKLVSWLNSWYRLLDCVGTANSETTIPLYPDVKTSPSRIAKANILCTILSLFNFLSCSFDTDCSSNSLKSSPNTKPIVDACSLDKRLCRLVLQYSNPKLNIRITNNYSNSKTNYSKFRIVDQHA